MRKFIALLTLCACCMTVWANQPFNAASVSCTASTSLDNTKVDWWLVRAKDHTTPRINEDIKFNISDYDAYYVGDTEEKVLYLTFDEGYEKGYTPAILDALKNTGVKAVFFVTSPYLRDNPDLVKRMIDEGHIVANHSKNHPSMPKYANDIERFKNEFKDVEDKYQSLTGSTMPKLFRPPMGHYSQKSLALTKELGYKTVFWSFAYKDFDVDHQPSPADAKKMILGNLHNGSIMLLHAVSKTNTQILEEVITEAQNMGYTFKLFE